MQSNLAHAGLNARSEPRDEVLHRARGTRADGVVLALTVVNVSPGGLMARCEQPLEPGDRISVALPLVGLLRAEVRWALGGRIGCQFEAPIATNRYYELVVRMR